MCAMQLHRNKLMGRSLTTEGCLRMLNVVELFQTGGLVDLVVDLVQLGLEGKTSIKSFLEGNLLGLFYLLYIIHNVLRGFMYRSIE